MTIKRAKLFATLAFVLPLLAFAIFFRTPPAIATATPSAADDPATVYKAKCAMCHSPKAEKSYDPALPQDQQIEAILKGKKAEKPPHMPGYETKGINAEQAKLMLDHMKSLRQ